MVIPNILFQIIFFLTCNLYVHTTAARGDQGRCTESYAVSVRSYYTTTYMTQQQVVYYTRCWSWDLKCTMYRTVDVVAYKTASTTTPSVRYRLCPASPCDDCVSANTVNCDRSVGICNCRGGWTGITCNENVPTDCPDCMPPCDEKCVSNNTYACNRECLCKPGWTGITCNETIPTTSTISGTQSINVELISSVGSSLSTNPANYSILATKSPLISETGSAGVLAGFVILAIVIVILIGGSIVCIVFIYRRRTGKPTSLHVDEAAGGLEMTEPRHIQEKGPVYQDVDQENSYSEVNFSHSNPTYELNDNGGEKNNLKCEIYAQPSRNVKSNPGNEDIDETDNPYTEMKQRYQMPRSIKDRNVGSTDSLPETNDSTLPSAWEARDTGGTDELCYDIPSSRQNTITTSDVSLVGNSISGQPEGYMAMGGSQYNTPRSVKTRFAGDGEDWYKSPRPLPSYAVINGRKPSDGEYSKINDKDNMYNTVDRTGRSYKNEGGPQTEYAHLGTDEEDKTEAYDKLDRLKKMSHLPGNQIVSDSSYDKIGQNENTDDDSEDIPTSPIYDQIGIDAKAESDQIDKCPMSPQYDVPRAMHDVDDIKDTDQTNGATSDDVPVSHNDHNNPNVNSESDENNQYDVPRHYSNKII